VESQARQRILSEGSAYVQTNYGRRRLVLHDHNKLYKLVNYLIQGTAAQVLKDRIVALDLADLTDYLVLPVHDELVFDVPRAEVDEYARAVQTVMNVSDRFMVPLTTSTKVVDRWGDAYPTGRYWKEN
jgi:DNA polymerase-1